MKKFLSLLLVVVMLLSLCACSKDDTQNTAPSATTGQETNNTDKPTDGTEGATEATQAPTDAPTEAPTVAPTTCSHSYSDATCTAPKTCTVCGATEGNAAGHSWKDATCAAPKTCSVCGATEGNVTDHTYQNATCTVCGAAEPNAVVIGEWILEGTTNSGEEYEKMTLTLGEETASLSIGYFGKLEYDSQEMLDAILKDGYYGTEEGAMYYNDILQYNGVYYYSLMWGFGAEGTYRVSGSTITIDLTSYYETTGKLVLSKTAENTLTVVSADEAVFDSTICEVFNNGRVFTKAG